MTLEKTNALIAMHVDSGNGYNRAAVKKLADDIDWDCHQSSVDQLIRFTSAFSR